MMATLSLRISAGCKKRSLGSSIYKNPTSRLIILVLRSVAQSGWEKMKIRLSYSKTPLLLNLPCTRIFLQKKWRHAHLFKKDREYPPIQTFLGVRHAFLPHERLLSWAEKERKPITADFQIWEVHFGSWEISRLTLSSRKDQKGLMKGEDLTVLEQTTQLTHKRSYSRLTISLKKITSEVKFAERKSALLQNNNVWKKNSAFCSVLTGNPAVASPNEQLYEQLTSNPVVTERNIQNPMLIS